MHNSRLWNQGLNVGVRWEQHFADGPGGRLVRIETLDTDSRNTILHFGVLVSIECYGADLLHGAEIHLPIAGIRIVGSGVIHGWECPEVGGAIDCIGAIVCLWSGRVHEGHSGVDGLCRLIGRQIHTCWA